MKQRSFPGKNWLGMRHCARALDNDVACNAATSGSKILCEEHLAEALNDTTEVAKKVGISVAELIGGTAAPRSE